MIASDLPEDELGALAFVVEQARRRTPGTEPWDRPGIVAFLRQLNLAAGDALSVALAAAADSDARMPVAITWPRYRSAVTSVRSVHSGPTCAVCQRSESTHRLVAEKTGDPHQFEPRAAR